MKLLYYFKGNILKSGYEVMFLFVFTPIIDKSSVFTSGKLLFVLIIILFNNIVDSFEVTMENVFFAFQNAKCQRIDKK